MSWARLDDSFHDHPKVQKCSLEAIGVWTLTFSWANRHLGASNMQPGFVPHWLPEMIVRSRESKEPRGTRSRESKIVMELVTNGLWDVVEEGWIIHDFEDYLPASKRALTRDDVRKARSEAGRRGAQARWQVAITPDGKPMRSEMPPSRPVPKELTRASYRSPQTNDKPTPTPPVYVDDGLTGTPCPPELRNQLGLNP